MLRLIPPLVWAGGAVATAAWSAPALPMAWMPICGRTWTDGAISSLGMWAAMSAAMMLPAVMPLLRRLGGPQALAVSAGYLLVWLLPGLAAYPLGALAGVPPWAAGIVVLAGGAVQLSAWKARQLVRCRALPETGPSLVQGLRLGVHCLGSCSGLTAILLVLGAMELRIMAAVTAAILLERLVDARIARISGTMAVGLGLLLVARSLAAA